MGYREGDPMLELRWKGFESDWRTPARYYKEWWATSALGRL